MKHWLQPFRDTAIAEGYKQGVEIPFLAARFGMVDFNVRRILHENNIPLRKAKRDDIRINRAKTERNAQIIALYESGKTLNEIAVEMEISRQRAHHILVRDNIPRRHTAAERHSRVIGMYQQGNDVSAISAATGYSRANIFYILRQHDVPLRPRVTDTKRCPRCQQEKSRQNDFYGGKGDCKPCNAERVREFHQRKREERKCL